MYLMYVSCVFILCLYIMYVLIGAESHNISADILREKAEIETRVRTLESLVINGTVGIPEAELAIIIQRAQEGGDLGTSTVSSKQLQDTQAELTRQNEKVRNGFDFCCFCFVLS